jgi:hypothetical protein
VPEAVTRSTLKQYRHSQAVTDIHEFPDRAHSLTMDSRWREVAEVALSWLAAQALGGSRPPVPSAPGTP